MEINGLGYSCAQDNVKEDHQDSQRQIDVLEKKKEDLEQKLKKENSPFALQQSKDHDSIKKKIEQLDKQIKELKTSVEKISISEISKDSEKSRNEKSNNTLSPVRRFDEFIPRCEQAEKPSAGIYSLAMDEDGEPAISFD